MALELVYTSAPKGLKPGSYGFCTVACSRGLPDQLANVLENLSGYRRVYSYESGQWRKNPPACSYVTIESGGRSTRVLARVADAGVDYSKRTNKIACFFVLNENRDCVTPGPAALFDAPDLFVKEWSETPRWIDAPVVFPNDLPEPTQSLTWRHYVGDPGWAAALASTVLTRRPVLLVVRPDQNVLELFKEAIALLPPARRWDATFATYYTKTPPNVKCLWKAVIAGSPEETALQSLSSTLAIDLKNPATLPPLNAVLGNSPEELRMLREAREGKFVPSPIVNQPQRVTKAPRPNQLPTDDIFYSSTGSEGVYSIQPPVFDGGCVPPPGAKPINYGRTQDFSALGGNRLPDEVKNLIPFNMIDEDDSKEKRKISGAWIWWLVAFLGSLCLILGGIVAWSIVDPEGFKNRFQPNQEAPTVNGEQQSSPDPGDEGELSNSNDHEWRDFKKTGSDNFGRTGSREQGENKNDVPSAALADDDEFSDTYEAKDDRDLVTEESDDNMDNWADEEVDFSSLNEDLPSETDDNVDFELTEESNSTTNATNVVQGDDETVSDDVDSRMAKMDESNETESKKNVLKRNKKEKVGDESQAMVTSVVFTVGDNPNNTFEEPLCLEKEDDRNLTIFSTKTMSKRLFDYLQNARAVNFDFESSFCKNDNHATCRWLKRYEGERPESCGFLMHLRPNQINAWNVNCQVLENNVKLNFYDSNSIEYFKRFVKMKITIISDENISCEYFPLNVQEEEQRFNKNAYGMLSRFYEMFEPSDDDKKEWWHLECQNSNLRTSKNILAEDLGFKRCGNDLVWIFRLNNTIDNSNDENIKSPGLAFHQYVMINFSRGKEYSLVCNLFNYCDYDYIVSNKDININMQEDVRTTGMWESHRGKQPDIPFEYMKKRTISNEFKDDVFVDLIRNWDNENVRAKPRLFGLVQDRNNNLPNFELSFDLSFVYGVDGTEIKFGHVSISQHINVVKQIDVQGLVEGAKPKNASDHISVLQVPILVEDKTEIIIE